MIVKCKIWPHPVRLIGKKIDQLEAARKACLIALSRRALWITVIDDSGRAVSGKPENMIGALHPTLWDQ